MAVLSVRPARSLFGEVTLPGDKSISHRAILLGALCRGTLRITHLLRSDDVGRSRRAVEELGISTREEGEAVLVEGRGPEALRRPSQPLDMGNSGTTTRLLLGILAGCPFEATLIGDESLSKRPMRRVTEPLEKMGAAFEGGDHLPLTVRGGALRGIRYTLPVASAQVKSAVLLAGLWASGATTVTEPIPTRDHTERMLRFLGARVRTSGTEVTVEPGPRLEARDLDVPGDISSGAFFLVAAAIVPGSTVTIRGVGLNPARTGLLDVLRRMGAIVTVTPAPDAGWEPRGDVTVAHRPLRAVTLRPSEVPGMIDEIPLLMVAASQAEGMSRMEGLAELRVKETDRIQSMVQGLSAMGARIRADGESLFVEGPARLRGCRVRSFSDHRTAMALAVAGLAAQGETSVQGSEWIGISFPEFAENLQRLRRD